MPERLRRDLARPMVTVLGHVANLADVFERVRLTVAPLRFGAGLKDKVLRSMAARLPCVGTQEAFSGMARLPVALTKACIAEAAGDLAAAIVQMHEDEANNTRCAELGTAYLRENYGAARIDTLMQELAEPALRRYSAVHVRAASGIGVLSFRDALAARAQRIGERQDKAQKTLVFAGRS
jgi:hypothetical protein